jgi:predicted RND superfamily exporter protein
MIHCGIFVVVSATGITGSSINFMAYVLAQCVVTGITLNYSIMFTKNYIDYRKECVVEDALSYAFKGTLNAILTSGLIMAIVAGILAIGYKDPMMAPMCGALAIGAITTIVLAICILPSVVAVCDKLIYHPKENMHHDTVESYQH